MDKIKDQFLKCLNEKRTISVQLGQAYGDRYPVGVDCRAFVHEDDATRQMVAFVHGYGTGFYDCINYIYAMFIKGYNVVTLSMPNHGASANTRYPYDKKCRYNGGTFYTEGYVVYDVIRQYMNERQKKRVPVHLIGYSMGAVIATYATIHRSDHIDDEFASLTLINPAGIVKSGYALPFKFAWAGWNMLKDTKTKRAEVPFPLPPFDITAWLHPIRLLSRLREYKQLREGGIVRLLCISDLPQLIVTGSLDTLFDADEIEDILERERGDGMRWYGRLEKVAGVHHNAMISHGEKVAEIVSSFIRFL